MPWGEKYTGSTLVSMYLAELAANAWDLAQATGQLGRLDPSLAQPALDGARAMINPGTATWRDPDRRSGPRCRHPPAPTTGNASPPSWDATPGIAGLTPDSGVRPEAVVRSDDRSWRRTSAPSSCRDHVRRDRVGDLKLFEPVAMSACHATQLRRALSFTDFRAEGQRIHMLGRTTTAVQRCHVVSPEQFGDSDTRGIGGSRRKGVRTHSPGSEGLSLRVFCFRVKLGKDPDDRFLEFR
jgi:hypothetical protein